MMSSKDTVLSVEFENLHRKENEMYKVYSELHDELKDNEIRKKIEFIRNQELAHIEMVTSMISLLREEISKG